MPLSTIESPKLKMVRVLLKGSKAGMPADAQVSQLVLTAHA